MLRHGIRAECARDMLEGREWFRSDGASVEALAKLKSCAAVPLPESYLALLAHSNGGEGPLAVQPCYFQLDPAETVAAGIEAGAHAEFFPGFLMIGSNGGGEFVAFDLRKPAPWPVVAIDMTNADLAESVQPIAADFDAFLGLVGREPDEP